MTYIYIYSWLAFYLVARSMFTFWLWVFLALGIFGSWYTLVAMAPICIGLCVAILTPPWSLAPGPWLLVLDSWPLWLLVFNTPCNEGSLRRIWSIYMGALGQGSGWYIWEFVRRRGRESGNQELCEPGNEKIRLYRRRVGRRVGSHFATIGPHSYFFWPLNP